MNDATDDTSSRSNSAAPQTAASTGAGASGAPPGESAQQGAPGNDASHASQAAPPRAEAGPEGAGGSMRAGPGSVAAPSVAPGSQAAPGQAPAGGPQDVASLRADVERFREQWMRAAADFDNFRKRARREIEDAKKSGREDLLREILPVFDNLERGIVSAQRATDVKAVADGLGMVLKQFVDTLGRAGITKIPGVGSPFDPAVHEAIQQVESNDQPPGVVIAEVQPGYVQGDRLIRAAMVVVSKAPSDGGESAN